MAKTVRSVRLEAGVEGGAAKRNKAVLRKYKYRINLDNTVADEIIVTTTDDLVAALGSAKTNNGDRTARHTTIERSNQL